MEIKNAIRILKMLPGDYEEEIEKLVLLQTIPEDSVFRIANAGSMNPGKSSLFNAFLGQSKSETFATSDVRQTTVCQEVMWKQGIALLDTPGCDSIYPEDEKESLSAFRKADYVLFVHNAETGDLNNSEIGILKLVQRVFGSEAFQKRVCFICTRSDSVTADDLVQVKHEVEKQMKENFGCQLTSFDVSARFYLNGIRQQEKGESRQAEFYLKESNMPALIDYVGNVCGILGKRPFFDWKCFEEKLVESQKEQKKIGSKNKDLLSQAQASAKKAGDVLLKNVKAAWKECADFKKKLDAFDNSSKTVKAKKTRRSFLASKLHDAESNLKTVNRKSVKSVEKNTGCKLDIKVTDCQCGYDSFEEDMKKLIGKIESVTPNVGMDFKKQIQAAEDCEGQIDELLSAIKQNHFEK